MNNKNYNWCKWHKAWVEHDPEGKGANVMTTLQEVRVITESCQSGVCTCTKVHPN